MNSFKKSLQVMLLSAPFVFSVTSANAAECADPVAAVIKTLECIEQEKAFCAASGYANNFVKLHNGIDTETPQPNFFFWFGAFYFTNFDLAFDHIVQTDNNQVSLRYVETVAFNDGDVFYQHEHALVTVDSRCKISLWDQYGDNAEQQAVEEKADEINPF